MDSKESMHLLGVTWVIISMKILYGLAISMYAWDWIGATELGVSLLGLVALNIAIAQHHDEDAIATQATLVLLAIGSAAGGPYGEEGVAIMIGIGTILFHALAYLRNSGNLASLGIAVSYLWIGLHAISNEWNVFGIQIKPFEDELLLFLLMFFVTGINAVTATKFAKAENWFSSAFKAMGLGKPGLWSVSVGLGMIGALLAIASNRLETGYALAQLILLLSAFAPSYLVVRGESWQRLQRYALWPAPILLAVLILMVRGVIDAPFSEPWSIYAAFSAAITTFANTKSSACCFRSRSLDWLDNYRNSTHLTYPFRGRKYGEDFIGLSSIGLGRFSILSSPKGFTITCRNRYLSALDLVGLLR